MTGSDLHGKMMEIVNGEEVYCIKSLREKFHEHYGDYISSGHTFEGALNVMCFRNIASYVIRRQWQTVRERATRTDAERIVLTCARLLKNKIHQHNFEKDVYPGNEEVRNIKKEKQYLTQ